MSTRAWIVLGPYVWGWNSPLIRVYVLYGDGIEKHSVCGAQVGPFTDSARPDASKIIRFPVNVPHPVRVGSEALAKSGLHDSCGLACFRTGSVWPKPDTASQNQIGPGPVLHSMIWDVCGRTQLSLKVGNWWRASCLLPESGPNGSCTPACFLTRCIWPKRDQAIQIGPGSASRSMAQAFFEKRNWIRCGKSDPAYSIPPDSGCTLALVAMTGCNRNASESDPACLLGYFSMFH